MASMQELLPLLTEPREDLAVEYKAWLDLTTNEHKATLARAAIALVNHGGGFIVLGFDEEEGLLHSRPRAAEIPDVTQDEVNAAIRRYCTPEFHCELHRVVHPGTSVSHPIIVVPGTLKEPVMSKRDCGNVIAIHRCYIRKPGPRSEEPQAAEEWRALFSRCVHATREDMLDAIRSILSGRATLEEPQPTVRDQLQAFCVATRERWSALTAALPETAGPRFPHGYYEMGFALIGAKPAQSRNELQKRLQQARRIKLTGWTPFLELNKPEWAPYAFEQFVEAWVGRPLDDEAGTYHDAPYSDFWRAALDGRLYTIRGYKEDAFAERPKGTLFDVTLPIWRIGEGILFAHRFAATFEGVEGIAIRCRYTGLEGRTLISLDNMHDSYDDRVSRSNEIVLEAQATVQQVQDNLMEVLYQMLIPLYECFSFMQLPPWLVNGELKKMTPGRF